MKDNKHLTAYLDEYLKMDTPQFAVMITGKWGCGKTYFKWDDIDPIARAIKQDLKIVATIDDLAAFYGQPNGNVRSLINRRMIQKPQRRVYYSFNAFSKIVPEKWKK